MKDTKQVMRAFVVFWCVALAALIFSASGAQAQENSAQAAPSSSPLDDKAPAKDVPHDKNAPYDKNAPVELTGDSIEFKAEESKFVASGNVVLKQNDSTLFCDKLEFYRDRKEAHAIGNIVLVSPKGTVWADKAFYNFETKRGEFTNARIMANPYFGKAASITKFHDDYYVLSDGWISTSDYDNPEYRIKSRKIEVYPYDRAIAHNSVMYLGGMPVMYMPKYVQYLNDDRPHLRVVPGYQKDLGAYVLMSTHMMVTDWIDTTYHLDLYGRKGVGYGVDADYNAWENGGHGLVKTYYINEHQLIGNTIGQTNATPTTGERYRIEWRHKWDIDPQTSFISQYYKVSDKDFIKEYFRREYQQDQNPPTYALLTHSMANATASLRADLRVNNFEAPVERLPEFNYSLTNQPISDTGFYVKSNNTISNLRQKDPSVSDNTHHTIRIDTDNELSRPFKVSFLEMRPYIGTEQTYYSNTLDSSHNDSVRGIFRTGMDVSTKFYRVYDVTFNKYGIEVNQLRHVITPTVGYLYQHHPTLGSEKLYGFDSMDARDTIDRFALGLDNTLQTKRDGKSVDLARSSLTTEFRLKDNPTPGSWGDMKWTNELYPNQYVTFHNDMDYNNDTRHLQTANFDLYLKDNKKWEFDIGRRYAHKDDDLVTTQVSYKFNPKWRTVVYDRWNVDTGHWQEQQYSFVRDLHSWEVEFAINNKKEPEKSGTEFWFIFRIKAFPSVKFNGSTSFSKREVGSQPQP
ncbi:MAG: LPS-assembly protein LptD [Candidatus Omnitrophica bacterium]|nr:LPS-assembly protein LptD [Candidatus Omnitrophota bacterium]